MSPKAAQLEAFSAVVAKVFAERGWADIDEIYKACRKARVFPPEFFKAAIEKAMKSDIRRLLRTGKFCDEEGNPDQVESIKLSVEDPETGEVYERRVYKQLSMFDIDDYAQDIMYWRKNRAIAQERIDALVRSAIKKFGPEVQGRLPLTD